MAKKKDEEIPTLGENIEKLKAEEETQEIEEPKQEESGLRLVTSEQMIQYRLDTLSTQLQELNSQMRALVEVLRKK